MDDAIKRLRERIDSIDTQIVELLGERFRLALPIAKAKREQGIDICDKGRENEVVFRLDTYGAKCGLPPGVVPCVYELLFDSMRDYQRDQRDQGND